MPILFWNVLTSLTREITITLYPKYPRRITTYIFKTIKIKQNQTSNLHVWFEGEYARNIEMFQLSNNYIMEPRRFSYLN
jgi:hypothetical protein